jgi:hypothetical protein
MIDLNDSKQSDRLKIAARNPSGKLIVSFLRQRLEDLKYENIDTKRSTELIGQDFKAVSETRKFIEKILDLLTPEKGD